MNKEFNIKKTYLKNINLDDKIFDSLRNDYDGFNDWFRRKSLENVECFYTDKDGQLTSIFIVKLNEIDKSFLEYDARIMKIRTLKVVNEKGLGKYYINLANNIAKLNNIDYVYVTFKEYNKEFSEFINKTDFKFYKKIDNEIVYVRKVK